MGNVTHACEEGRDIQAESLERKKSSALCKKKKKSAAFLGREGKKWGKLLG